jgi:hypothetical protein
VANHLPITPVTFPLGVVVTYTPSKHVPGFRLPQWASFFAAFAFFCGIFSPLSSSQKRYIGFSRGSTSAEDFSSHTNAAFFCVSKKVKSEVFRPQTGKLSENLALPQATHQQPTNQPTNQATTKPNKAFLQPQPPPPWTTSSSSTNSTANYKGRWMVHHTST